MSAAAPSIDHNGAKVSLNMAPALTPFTANNYLAGGAGAAAAITFDADASRPNVVKQIHCSYSAAPAAGAYVQIEDGSGNTVWKMFILNAGEHDFTFELPKSGTKNTAMIVTLSAPGGAVVGTLYADVYTHL